MGRFNDVKERVSMKPCVGSIVLLLLVLAVAGCGGSSSEDGVLKETNNPPNILGESADNLPVNLQVDSEMQEIATPPSEARNDNTIRTTHDDYSGKVVIKFKDGSGVRVCGFTSLRVCELGEGPFVVDDDLREDDGPADSLLARRAIARKSLRKVNEIIIHSTPPLGKWGEGGFSRVKNIIRVMRATEEEVDRWRGYWARQGVELHDWNLYYYLDVPRYEDAVELIKELNPLSSPFRKGGEEGDLTATERLATDDRRPIDYAEILPIFYLTEVTTPDISGEQGYLKSAVQGGLGVEDAWAKLDGLFPDIELRGQNSMVVDHEFDWNFNHEILPIDETDEYFLILSISGWNTYGPNQGKDIPANINHGTAVVGIVAGQGNEINKGISGIAPSTSIFVTSMSDNGALGASPLLAEGIIEDKIGSIYLIEVQQRGITTTASGCDVGDGVTSPVVTGCVPIESHKYLYQLIKDSTSTGRVVIIGAGNGSVNLNDDSKAAPIEGMGAFSYFNKPENDSGATMVGASLGADKRKASWSNCGDRVDVFAWGAGVVTSGYGDKFNPDGVDPNTVAGADNPKLYTGQFGGTSAATAQIAGVAALIQSYMRQRVEEAGFVGKTVYLNSKEIRNILKQSGQPAVYGQTPDDPNPNCNIGVQPDANIAIDRTEEYITNPSTILKIVPLNKEALKGPSGINYDMDGDGHAELISFSRDHKFYVDLSSVQPPASSVDGYGAWDLILDATPSPTAGEGWGEGAMLFPVVNDYSPDGIYHSKRLADLALYDSINGKWYIKYTTQKLINSQTQELVWDKIIDYSTDPAWKPYSRPVPGNYDGDGFLDMALQTPDGHWLIDYGGVGGIKVQLADGSWITATSNGQPPDESAVGEWTNVSENIQALDRFGSFEKDVKYLTDEQLAEAPGWAWLGFINQVFIDYSCINYRAPDGTLNAGDLYMRCHNDDFVLFAYDFPSIYGDNDEIMTTADFTGYEIGGYYDIGLKSPNGTWNIAWYSNGWQPFEYVSPASGYGDILCRPIPADYDGDGKDDRVVQCGTTWKIAYSADGTNLREIELDQAIDPLPAYVYAGGIKYRDQLDLFNYYKLELQCGDSLCSASSTIYDVNPPIGPYFAECVKYWAPKATYCWDK